MTYAQHSREGAGRPTGIFAVAVAAVVLLLFLLLLATAGGNGYVKQRERMVDRQIAGRGIRHEEVLRAMREVERHAFVPRARRGMAYADAPLSIGEGQTISQPYMVAAMTEAIDPKPGDVVLEVGTGSGYQAAVLARLVEHVYTIEIIESLADSARERLEEHGCTNVTVRAGDGYAGWPEHAPFDAIVVTAAPDHVPEPLVEQLRPGGRMVIPVGEVHRSQELLLIEKDADGDVIRRTMMPVRFVPLTGGHDRP